MLVQNPSRNDVTTQRQFHNKKNPRWNLESHTYTATCNLKATANSIKALVIFSTPPSKAKALSPVNIFSALDIPVYSLLPHTSRPSVPLQLLHEASSQAFVPLPRVLVVITAAPETSLFPFKYLFLWRNLETSKSPGAQLEHSPFSGGLHSQVPIWHYFWITLQPVLDQDTLLVSLQRPIIRHMGTQERIGIDSLSLTAGYKPGQQIKLIFLSKFDFSF